MPITSTHNPAVRYVRSLERASDRREERAYLTEGVRLVTEALRSGQTAPLVLYDPEALHRTASGSSLAAALPDWAERALEVTPRVLAAASDTESPAGVIAVLRRPEPPPLAAHAGDRLGVLLDRIADPGNAGTILRSAAAFGARYAISLPGSADLFAPKVVRGGMGAHFRLDLYAHLSWEEVRRALPEVSMVAAAAGQGEAVTHFSWPAHALLVIGSEAAGISAGIEAAVDGFVHIPMAAGVESLNAAVAGSILLFSACLDAMEP